MFSKEMIFGLVAAASLALTSGQALAFDVNAHGTEQACLAVADHESNTYAGNMTIKSQKRTEWRTACSNKFKTNGLITIMDVSYGYNCTAQTGQSPKDANSPNKKADIEQACNGKKSCSYTVNHQKLGDPAPGCGKAYTVRYRCDALGAKDVNIPAEASGKVAQLGC